MSRAGGEGFKPVFSEDEDDFSTRSGSTRAWRQQHASARQERSEFHELKEALKTVMQQNNLLQEELKQLKQQELQQQTRQQQEQAERRAAEAAERHHQLLQAMMDSQKQAAADNRALIEALAEQQAARDERQAELQALRDRDSRVMIETMAQQQRERDERLEQGQKEMREDMRNFGGACIEAFKYLADIMSSRASNALPSNSNHAPAALPPPPQPKVVIEEEPMYTPPPDLSTYLNLRVWIKRWRANGNKGTTYRLCFKVVEGPDVSNVRAHLSNNLFNNPDKEMKYDSRADDWWFDWTGRHHFPLSISFCVKGKRRCVAFEMTANDHHSHYNLKL